MTKADKMFKEIFYEKTADNVDFVEYTNTITKSIIRLWKRRRTLYCWEEVNMRVYKAIDEKIHELGWLDNGKDD